MKNSSENEIPRTKNNNSSINIWKKLSSLLLATTPAASVSTKNEAGGTETSLTN